MMLGDHEKWEAVRHCDQTFDGRFYYGVKTTGIFCRPSCKSKTPLRENVEFFEDSSAACASGMRPCKRCRPDLLEYNPTQELLLQIKSIFDNDYTDRGKLASKLKQVPVSPTHLTRLFQQYYGMTPTEYQNRLKLANALECLSVPGLSVLDVALASGFGSLSSFYACFRKNFGVTPAEYRRQHGLNGGTARETIDADL